MTTCHFQWHWLLTLPSPRDGATRLVQLAGRGMKGTAIEFSECFATFRLLILILIIIVISCGLRIKSRITIKIKNCVRLLISTTVGLHPGLFELKPSGLHRISWSVSPMAANRDRMSGSKMRPMDPMRKVSAWLILPG